MKHDELVRLLQSNTSQEVKKVLQHIRIMISEQKKLSDDILILMLQSNLKAAYNTALKYLIRQKQKSVFSKLPVPVQFNKGAIFDHACYELWRYVRKRDFDTSKEGAIERFLRVLCKRYIFKLTKNPKGNHDYVDLKQVKELSDNPSPPIYDADAYEFMQQLFNNVGKSCKEILTLRYYKDRKFKEIAEEIDSTEGSVKVTFSRCMGKLRTWVAKNDDLAKYVRALLSS